MQKASYMFCSRFLHAHAHAHLLLLTGCDGLTLIAAIALQELALQRQKQAEGQREALLQAQKASYRHRSRLERALSTPAAEAAAPELDGADHDGLPEDSLSQLPDRLLSTPLSEVLNPSVCTSPKDALDASLLLTAGCLLPSMGAFTHLHGQRAACETF